MREMLKTGHSSQPSQHTEYIRKVVLSNVRYTGGCSIRQHGGTPSRGQTTSAESYEAETDSSLNRVGDASK